MPTHYMSEAIGDTEYELEIEFTITSRGSPPHMGSLSYPGDPGDPPEIEIDSVMRRSNDPEGNEVEEDLDLKSIPATDLERWENSIFDKWDNYDDPYEY
jgi:hypothetical protein